MFVKFALSLLFCSIALIGATSYDGYKIYDITAKSTFEKQILLRMADYADYDFFELPKELGKAARVMVQPKDQTDFETLLNRFGIEVTTINENFGETLKAERRENELARARSRAATQGITFNAFHRFSEINAYLDELAKNYPSRVTVKSIGKSYEGRDLKTITITNGDGRANKNVIFVDAGIHAREWIAPAGALQVIYQLVENFAAHTDLLKNYDWVVLPVVNPDGYEYSHTTTRMWRKTRQPVSSLCSGTDGNRNFDFHWGLVGASSYSCADTFMGVTPFSEPETQAVRDVLLSLSGRAKFYLTLHSYGNYLLYPWGWTSALPDTWRTIDEVAQAGAAAIRASTGTRYTVGSSTNVLYAAAGGSDDWAFAVANIPISITMELPAGGTGFDPTVAQIQPFVAETWTGIRAMALKVMDLY